MDNEALNKTIIRLAKQQLGRAEIIRMLIAEGYESSQIEEVINELYYSGKLSFDVNDSIEQAGIHTVDRSVENPDLKIEKISRWTRISIWVRVHPGRAFGVMSGVLILIAGIVGGLGGYTSAPTTVLNTALTRLAQSKVISYEMSGSLKINTSQIFKFASQGTIATTPSTQAVTSITFQENDQPQWSMDVVHTSQDAIFIKLIRGPLPYSFLYNQWILVGTSQEDIEALQYLGLQTVVSHAGILRPFPKDAVSIIQNLLVTPGVYTSITPRTDLKTTCPSPYTVAFDSTRVIQGASVLLGDDPQVLSFIAESPWDICIDAGGSMQTVSIVSADARGSVKVSILPTKTIPSFSVDVSATPLTTIAQWVREGKQK